MARKGVTVRQKSENSDGLSRNKEKDEIKFFTEVIPACPFFPRLTK